MPISDNSNYPDGHFHRVYEHLIIPACENAGFSPIRADDVLNTNYIALDVLSKIVESEMVICDLSSQNPNVLYELGIRQAFNKPVTLIKDTKTKRIFDIQGFRDFEYDETLRVDNVQNDIEKLSQIILSTHSDKDSDINSLVSLLSLSPAKIDSKTEISSEAKLILNSLSELDKRLSSIENISKKKTIKLAVPPKLRTEKFYGGSLPGTSIGLNAPENVGDYFTPEELKELKKGTLVYHNRFGYGELLRLDKIGSATEKLKGEIQFNDFGKKLLLLDYAKLRKVQ